MLLIPFLILIAVLFALGWYHFRIKSSMRIVIEQDVSGSCWHVFDAISNLQSWRYWNAWISHEPSVVVTHSDVINSVGARISWHARKVGAGSVTTQKMQPHNHIVHKLTFSEPYNTDCTIDWSIRSTDDNKSHLLVTVQTTLPWLLKWQHVKWRRNIYKNALYSLDLLSRYIAKDNPSLVVQDSYDIKFMQAGKTEACSYVYESFSGTLDELIKQLPKKMATIFTEIATRKGKITHYPFCLYQHYSIKTNHVRCQIAIPVTQGFSLARYKVGTLKAMPVLQTNFSCALRNMPERTPVAWYQALQQAFFMKAKQHKSIVGLAVYTSDLVNSDKDAIVTSVLQIPYR